MALLFAAVTLIGFAIRNYLWLLSMTEDIKCDLESINRNSKFTKSRLQIVRQFSELVHFHAKMIQLSTFGSSSLKKMNKHKISISRLAKDISKLTEFVYSLLFAWSLLSICSSMMLLQMKIVEYRILTIHISFANDFFGFLFQRQHETISLLSIILILETFYSFALIFIACELGERASLAFIEIDYMVGQFNLYNFPTVVKKMLPIFLIVVQEPFSFIVFGSLTVGRESFKKVSLVQSTKFFLNFNMLSVLHLFA